MRCCTSSKINLFLKVTARRDDGYHELNTIFIPLHSPCDTLEFLPGAPGSGITFASEAFPDCNDAKNNLVVKAAGLYAEAAGMTACDWHFVLHKNIPVAAGLGGGSGNAAGVLQMLNEHYQALSKEQLHTLALKLGADVPFFLHSAPAHARGVGEILEPLPQINKFPAVLTVFPGFPVSAKWAYTHLNAENISPVTPEQEKIISRFRNGDAGFDDCISLVHNDLAFALYEKFPLLTLLREFLLSNGALAAEISGSGSSLFALFETPEHAEKCGAKLRSSVFGNRTMRIFTPDKEL